MEYRLHRHNDVDLVFDGDLLAEVSSHVPGMSRWSEVRIYSTSNGQWVTEVVGRTTHVGEVDRSHVAVHQDVNKVRFGLMRTDKGKRYLTDMGYQALEEAAQADPHLAPALTERI